MYSTNLQPFILCGAMKAQLSNCAFVCVCVCLCVCVCVCALVFVLLLLWEDTCPSWDTALSLGPLFCSVIWVRQIFTSMWYDHFFKCWAWAFYTDLGNSSLTKWSWELSITTEQTPYTVAMQWMGHESFFSLAFGDHLNSWMCYS